MSHPCKYLEDECHGRWGENTCLRLEYAQRLGRLERRLKHVSKGISQAICSFEIRLAAAV